MPAWPASRRIPMAARAALGLLVAVLSLAGPAPGARAAVVAVADQKTSMFTDPLFTGLGVRQARYVVPWDAMDGGFQRDELFAWLRAARSAGVRPLLTFGHSRRAGREKLRPSPTLFQHEFRQLRVNFPWVREYATWNEANHCSQPLCHRPELAARYFDAIKRSCPSCTVLAAEVLDSPNMVSWVRSFRRAATHKATIWGLHNYLDVNRLSTRGTRALLRATSGQLWFTETGGIVHRATRSKIPFPEGQHHAAQATRWLFDRLIPLSTRIARVYLYHWIPGGPGDTWDSALVGLDGRPREAYRVVRSRVVQAIVASGASSARVAVSARGRAAGRAR